MTPIQREVIAGDLLDENFTHLEAYISHERRLSGWDVRFGENGSFDYGFGEWFMLIGGVRMTKRFIAQSAGRVTLEFRFRTPVRIPGASWELRCGETAAVRILTSDDSIRFDGGFGGIVLSNYKADTEYGVKVAADLDTCEADVYVSGLLKLRNARFLQKVDFLDNICISTGGGHRNELFLNPVRIHRGYLICERFLTCAPRSIPSDWIADNRFGAGSAQEFRCSMAPDVFSYRMENAGPGHNVSLTKRIGPVGGKLTFEFRFLMQEQADRAGVLLTGGGESLIGISTLDRTLYFNSRDGEPRAIQPCVRNLWHHVRLEADFENGGFVLHVNGKMKLDGTFISTSAQLDTIEFHTSDRSPSVLWIDDILLYPTAPEPEDYVPEPKPVNGGARAVGMQVCSLWREGHHNGWDFIKPYPERKPLLGWYEEGPPEVSDWEIKWMSEHGVDFQFYCWYRPGTGLGNPIKNPLEEFNLHDGYFYAKYSAMLRFAIMFENGNTKCAGFDDLINNLIPFWTEYYFKDPRYMSVGGRAVFGIYSVDGLIRDFGGEAGAKEALALIRRAIAAAGHEGAILLCECRDRDAKTMAKIKAAGFDAIYAYTWYTGDPEKQKAKIAWQRDEGVIEVVPTISMGWQTAPWGEAGTGKDGGFATPEEFGDLCRWTRDTFAAGPESTGMVLLDNWNEYGEGHFMMPSGLCGFGYLDAVREAFANEDGGGAHEDIAPTEKQRARFDTLYPEGDW